MTQVTSYILYNQKLIKYLNGDNHYKDKQRQAIT